MRISFIGAGKLARKRSEQLAGRNDVTILGYVGKGEARARELAAVYQAKAYGCMLEFHSGAVGVIQTTIHAPGYFMSLRIVGSEGSIDCRHSAGGAPFVVKARGGKESSELPVVGNGKRLDIDSWLDSIDSGKNCLMTPEDIAHWHLVAYACQESQKTGQTVRL